MDPDTRWIQRYDSFARAYLLLSEALQIQEPSVIERIGLVKLFEMAFELSWKLLKDYELNEGIEAKSPREAIKQAYQLGLIEDGHEWLNILKDRNLTAHTYKEDVARTIEKRIRDRYYPLIVTLHQFFKAKKVEAENAAAEKTET